ncbi:hypothetical protein HZC32_02900, partial [Candidatus Woesearchaeota archaeon]|nr:hypothetical protein [Candidatus Woesearchaeota archaeon]
MVAEKRGMFWVVLALFLVIFTFAVWAEQTGCYVYPKGSDDVYCKSNILNSAAAQDCQLYSECSMAQYFLPGADCNTLSECKKTTCNVDCQYKPWGKCLQAAHPSLAPQPVTKNNTEEYNHWCGPSGCCKFTISLNKEYCQFNLNRYNCYLQAMLKGISLAMVIFDNSL